MIVFLLLQTANRAVEGRCVSGRVPLPYDFFGRLIEAADITGRSGMHKRRAVDLGSPPSSQDRDILGLMSEIK